MTLYLIGIGLNDEKDITLKGLEIVKKCSKVFLESYTSILQIDISKLEELYGKKVILADRELVEKNSDEILSGEDVAFLVIGDALSATTHVDLMERAKEKNINVEVIHNAAVLTAVGVTGLQLYKFGKTTSIPFHDAVTPCRIIKENQSIGAHTLCLLDLDPINNKFLTIKEGIDKLIEGGFKEDTLCVGCARLGSKDFVVKTGTAKELKEFEFGSAPYCLIVPGDLHFVEEEIIKNY
ncbi:diphthine synthase [Nanoarchaeota archaeon]